MAKNTDLHTHSLYSDGQLSPKELVRLAKERGIKNLALTDHNSVKGVEEAVAEGKRVGVNVIPAVEVETDTGEILAYFVNPKDKELNKVLKQNCEKTESRTKEWCVILRKAGYEITFEELVKAFQKAKGNINAFYLLRMLYLKGYGEPRKLVPEFKQKKLVPNLVKMISTLKTVKTIRKAGGVPVLAHPWVDKMDYNFKHMKEFVKAGLAGIEINNGDKAPFKKKGTDKKIRSIAKKYNLILTSGSDYHGEEIVKLMPGDHNLGHNNCDEKIVKKLKELSLRRRV